MADPLSTLPHARFTPAHRLHAKPEFDLLYREGRRVSNSHFLILSKPNNLGHPRLGLSISAKAAGNAVNRNRVKRVLRESFRTNHHRLPAVDIVVNARPATEDADNQSLARSIEQLWDKLARHA